MQFERDWTRDGRITALLNVCRKSEKFRSTDLDGAPLEGSTIFLSRSSLGRTSMESCRLAELKYAIFSRTGRKTKKLRCSKDEKITTNFCRKTLEKFHSTELYDAPLEGSTIFLRRSSASRMPLESSRLT